MRARSLGVLAGTVTACAAFAPAAVAAPETVARAELAWALGERLDGRLERSCVRPRFPTGTGPATGTVDAAARTGAVRLTQGTFRFATTRRAARGVRSLALGHLGVQLAGQGGYLVDERGRRIARIPKLTLRSGPAVARGKALPNTYRLTLRGAAEALAPLAALSDARCRGGRARAPIRAGSAVGTVSLSFSPARAVGAGGSVALRLFLSAPRDPATGVLRAITLAPISPARADGESVAVPVTGATPLARAGDVFLPDGTVTTSAGAVLTDGAGRVELRDLAFVFSPARGLEVLSATIGGTRQVIGTLGADRAWAAEPAAMAAIAAGLGLPSVTLTNADADASFTTTRGT